MALFADYEPLRHGTPPPAGLTTRPAVAADGPELAALRAARDGISEAAATTIFDRHFTQAQDGTSLILVASFEGRVVGYGVAERLVRVGLPEGWYLGGVVVEPPRRRRGIGARLTSERLAWIAARARQAYYFVNERNRASIDLHARVGFRELARDIRVAGLSFAGGVGLLFGLDLA